jgi:hypothetical protein
MFVRPNPFSKPTPIRVVQLNAQRKKEVVSSLLNEHTDDFDIIILQEPPWSFIGCEGGKEVIGPVAAQGWIPISPFPNPNPTRPRTLTYFKRRQDFTVTLRPDLCEDRDIQILDIRQSNHPPVFLINIYNDTAGLRNDCILKRLANVPLPPNTPSIITGDFNLHHTLWSKGTPLETTLTDGIVDWLTLKGFSVMNTKGEVTHPARHGNESPSVIDLTFVNGEALNLGIVNEWAVDPTLAHDSDHFAIRFQIDQVSEEIDNLAGEKYSLKEADAQNWITTLSNLLQNRISPGPSNPSSQMKHFPVTFSICANNTNLSHSRNHQKRRQTDHEPPACQTMVGRRPLFSRQPSC